MLSARIERIITIAAMLLAITAWTGPLWAGAPTELIKEKTDEIKKIMTDPDLQQKKNDRKATVSKIVDDLVDWQEAAKRALGVNWKKRSTQEREEFIRVFKNLLDKTYGDKLELFSGQEIIFESEKIDDDYATVKSKVIDKKKGTEVGLDFRLLKENGKWLVYDLSAEGISVLNNYRAQFDEIIADSSYDELIKKMKNKELGTQPSPASKGAKK
jgi:phospholipid transport system substrate-binding protein